jgi:hypothetical protein
MQRAAWLQEHRMQKFRDVLSRRERCGDEPFLGYEVAGAFDEHSEDRKRPAANARGRNSVSKGRRLPCRNQSEVPECERVPSAFARRWSHNAFLASSRRKCSFQRGRRRSSTDLPRYEHAAGPEWSAALCISASDVRTDSMPSEDESRLPPVWVLVRGVYWALGQPGTILVAATSTKV